MEQKEAETDLAHELYLFRLRNLRGILHVPGYVDNDRMGLVCMVHKHALDVIQNGQFHAMPKATKVFVFLSVVRLTSSEHDDIMKVVCHDCHPGMYNSDTLTNPRWQQHLYTEKSTQALQALEDSVCEHT